MKGSRKYLLGAAVAIVAGLVLGLRVVLDQLTVDLPDYPPLENAVWLDQNWSVEQREWYHYADQGTRTFLIPYEWFVALEQPIVSLSAVGLLSDPAYLDRYGFIPGSTQSRRQELPIGFTRGQAMQAPDGSPWLNPQTRQAMTGLGLSCAACHTGR
jgi:hypothetical protein